MFAFRSVRNDGRSAPVTDLEHDVGTVSQMGKMTSFLTTFGDFLTSFHDLVTMVVAGAQRLAGAGFVGNQGVAGRCGSGMKGYCLFNKINVLCAFLTISDDK